MLSAQHILILRNARDKHNGLVAEAELDDQVRDALRDASAITWHGRGDPPGWYVTIIGEEHLDRAGLF